MDKLYLFISNWLLPKQKQLLLTYYMFDTYFCMSIKLNSVIMDNDKYMLFAWNLKSYAFQGGCCLPTSMPVMLSFLCPILLCSYSLLLLSILPVFVWFHQAVLETVARVKPKKNDTKEEKYMLLSSVYLNDLYCFYILVVYLTLRLKLIYIWT